MGCKGDRKVLHSDLEGTVQHQWMHNKKDVKPEIDWSQFIH